MAQALSNLNISLPLSSLRTTNHPSLASKDARSIRVMAMAGENRDNLDHLQRVTKPQNGKRVAPVSPIGLWDRFPTASTVQQMMDTMERIMEDPFAYSGGLSSPAANGIGGYGKGRTPWEIKEGAEEYKMRFDIPGMTKDDVKVWVEEKMLVVKGEKMVNENGEDDEWSAKSYGKYSWRIALPENVKMEEIKAEVRDGVLYISLPKGGVVGKVLDINVV